MRIGVVAVLIAVTAVFVVAGMRAAHSGAPAPVAQSDPGPDAPWFGTPAIWQPPTIYWQPPTVKGATIEYFDVAGTTQVDLIDSLNRVAGTRAWAWTDLQPRPIGCYLALFPYQDRTHEVIVHMPRWAPPRNGSVRLGLVERWNALRQSLYAQEVGYFDTYRDDIQAIMDEVHALPDCPSILAYLNDGMTWQRLQTDRQRIDADRGSRMRGSVADCRPESGCRPQGWMGW
jgi:hypothetical protein